MVQATLEPETEKAASKKFGNREVIEKFNPGYVNDMAIPGVVPHDVPGSYDISDAKTGEFLYSTNEDKTAVTRAAPPVIAALGRQENAYIASVNPHVRKLYDQMVDPSSFVPPDATVAKFTKIPGADKAIVNMAKDRFDPYFADMARGVFPGQTPLSGIEAQALELALKKDYEIGVSTNRDAFFGGVETRLIFMRGSDLVLDKLNDHAKDKDGGSKVTLSIARNKANEGEFSEAIKDIGKAIKEFDAENPSPDEKTKELKLVMVALKGILEDKAKTFLAPKTEIDGQKIPGATPAQEQAPGGKSK